MTTQDPSGIGQEKEYGDSASSVSPDTQYADPTEGRRPDQAADREDDTWAAGTADEHGTDEDSDEDDHGVGDEDTPNPQGTDADTMSDGPDRESGFYG